MPITKEEVAHVAKLAHLEITEEELEMFAPQMASIVEYVEQLNAIDTSNIEPALGGLTPEGEATNSSRDDIQHESLGQQAALDQAPDPNSGHFRVPKVL